MPLTEKGEKIMRAMKEEYGPDKGEQVFYASANKGKIKGVHGDAMQVPPVRSQQWAAYRGVRGDKAAVLDAVADALDGLTKRFDDMCRDDFFGTYGTYGMDDKKRDDDASMSFPAKRARHAARMDDDDRRVPRARTSIGQSMREGATVHRPPRPSAWRDDDDISASGARKAAETLERRGDPYRRDAKLGSKNEGLPKVPQGPVYKQFRDDDHVVHETLVRDRRRD